MNIYKFTADVPDEGVFNHNIEITSSYDCIFVEQINDMIQISIRAETPIVISDILNASNVKEVTQ